MNKYIYILFLLSFVLTNESPLLENYHTYSEIQEKLIAWDEMYGNQDNPQPSYYSDSGIIYKLEEIGVSNVNQLPIYAVKLSYNANQDLDKPRVLILGQCHAEEIYGVEISMALIEMFLDPSLMGVEGYEHLPNPLDIVPITTLRQILSRIEIWVIPTHNPDGLQMVHGYEDGINQWIQDVSYRKNITDVNNNGLFDYISYVMGSLDAGNDLDGVDLNRNYDFHFDNNHYFGGGTENLNVDDDYGSCGAGSYEYRSPYDYYRGPSAFSESETAAIRDFALENSFILSIAYHSSRSGCVSEKVIYPWHWKTAEGVVSVGKKSPDFQAISSIGNNLATSIPTQDNDLHDLWTYKPSASSKRRGQAHDWFYAKTNCFQYLVEAGAGGDEGIQTSSINSYNEVIRNNFNGLFYLLYRSLGNVNLNDVDQYGITGVIVDKNTELPIENVIYEIDEIYTPILSPRKTDEFGRYRWLLSDQDNSRHISFKHWDYESLPSQSFDIGSSSITELNIELVPKEEHQMRINLSGSDNALMVLANEDRLVDSLFISEGINIIDIPQGIYDLQISSDGYCPIIEQLVINVDNTLDVNLTPCNKSSVVLLESDSLNSESDIYNSNINICREYGDFEDASFLYFNMAYELEWEHDSLLIYLSDENVPDYIYTNQNWTDNNYYIKLNENTDYSDLHLKFCLITDESFGYKGVKINEVSALSGNSDFTLFNGIELPIKISLEQNYPNPFNAATKIIFSLSKPSNISLKIYNIKGDLVDEIINNKYYNTGKFSIVFESENLSSGVYFYKLNTEKNAITKKMIYLK